MKIFFWIYIYTIVFIGGISVGSFMNVLIYRLPRRISTARGRSFCPHCSHKLSWPDLFPLFSYIFLGGRCRYCNIRISPQYAAVELINALLWLAYAYRFMQFPLTMAAHFIFGSALICIIFIDAKHMLIFDRFNIAIAAAGVMTAADIFFHGNLQQGNALFPNQLTISDRLIGAICISGLFLLIALISRGRAMGGGDIKLTAAAGLFLGWRNMLAVLIAASFAGTIGYIIMIAASRASGRRRAGKAIEDSPQKAKDNSKAIEDGCLTKRAEQYKSEDPAMGLGHAVPFGPYLAGAMIFASFYGDEIISFYLKLCGF